MTYLTPNEYKSAKTLAHAALAAFAGPSQLNTRAILSDVVSQARAARDVAKGAARDASVLAVWLALDVSVSHMLRGDTDRACETRTALHATLESARAIARGKDGQ